MQHNPRCEPTQHKFDTSAAGSLPTSDAPQHHVIRCLVKVGFSGRSDQCCPRTPGQSECDWKSQKSLRDLALFNLAIDSKLRAGDLVTLKVADIFAAG